MKAVFTILIALALAGAARSQERRAIFIPQPTPTFPQQQLRADDILIAMLGQVQANQAQNQAQLLALLVRQGSFGFQQPVNPFVFGGGGGFQQPFQQPLQQQPILYQQPQQQPYCPTCPQQAPTQYPRPQPQPQLFVQR
jgi:hypothetical protein